MKVLTINRALAACLVLTCRYGAWAQETGAAEQPTDSYTRGYRCESLTCFGTLLLFIVSFSSAATAVEV